MEATAPELDPEDRTWIVDVGDSKEIAQHIDGVSKLKVRCHEPLGHQVD